MGGVREPRRFAFLFLIERGWKINIHVVIWVQIYAVEPKSQLYDYGISHPPFYRVKAT
jgi:hypothetical protein